MALSKYKLLVILLLSIYNTFVMATNLIPNNPAFQSTNLTTPDPKYDAVLSPNGPEIPQYELEKAISTQADDLLHEGQDTYTYVRCYYTTETTIDNSNRTNSQTYYVWALNSSGEFYKLNGYWHKDGILQWKNMFYTDIDLKYIQTLCNQNVKAQVNPKYSSFDQDASDNQFSFNHTIWQNDTTDTSSVNKVIAFGDSLSDKNNMYNASMWKLPNNASWFQGRFSNGRTWVEYLANDLNIPLYNWAVGGAAGDTEYLVIPGLISQIQSWVEYMKFAKNYNPQQSLFTLWIGGNDFINYNRTPNDVIHDLTDALTMLANNGAVNILLLNLPDLTAVPVFNMGKNPANVQANVNEFNRQIINVAKNLRDKYPQIHIQLFDTYNLFNQMLINPPSYGFKNTHDTCLNISNGSNLNYLISHNLQPSCENPSQYVFWDSLHPTTQTHRVIATEIFKSIQLGSFVR